MGNKRKVIDKEFKMNTVQHKKEHPELTYTEIANHLIRSVSLVLYQEKALITLMRYTKTNT